MKHIKEWLIVAEQVASILKNNPNDAFAKDVQILAGVSLIKEGYPCNVIGNVYELELGAHTMTVSKSYVDASSPNAIRHIQRESLKEAVSEIKKALLRGNTVAAPETEFVPPINKQDSFQNFATLTKEHTNENEDTPSIMTVPNNVMGDFATMNEGTDVGAVSSVQEDTNSVMEEDFVSMATEAKDTYQKLDYNDDAPTSLLNQRHAKPVETIPEKKLERMQPTEEHASQSITETAPIQTEPISVHDNQDPYRGYQEHLAKNEILFQYHKISIHAPASSSTYTAEVITSPLSLKNGESRIMAWFNDRVKTETKVSKNGRASVLVQLGDIPLAVEGRVENSTFKSTVDLTKRFREAGYTIEVKTKTYGTFGHVRIVDDGIAVHVVPTSTRNRASGSAEFFYMIAEDGQEAVVGDNLGSDDIRFTYRGAHLKLRAKWHNDVLYAAVQPI